MERGKLTVGEGQRKKREKVKKEMEKDGTFSPCGPSWTVRKARRPSRRISSCEMETLPFFISASRTDQLGSGILKGWRGVSWRIGSIWKVSQIQ